MKGGLCKEIVYDVLEWQRGVDDDDDDDDDDEGDGGSLNIHVIISRKEKCCVEMGFPSELVVWPRPFGRTH